MDRWEYCYADMLYHRVFYFTSKGFKEQKIKKDKSIGDGSKDDAFARAIAQMGKDGWELINGAGDMRVVLFFRRRMS